MIDGQQPTHAALGVDLRGTWNHPNQGPIEVTQPEQFVAYGIRVSREAIRQTPGWGEEALKSYDDAVELARSGEPFKLEKEQYILDMYQDRTEEASMRATSNESTPAATSEIPFTPNHDLTGEWGYRYGHFEATSPEDLGRNDIRALPAAAFEATWPNSNAYQRYLESLPVERTAPSVRTLLHAKEEQETGVVYRTLIDEGQPD